MNKSTLNKIALYSAYYTMGSVTAAISGYTIWTALMAGAILFIVLYALYRFAP